MFPKLSHSGEDCSGGYLWVKSKLDCTYHDIFTRKFTVVSRRLQRVIVLANWTLHSTPELPPKSICVFILVLKYSEELSLDWLPPNKMSNSAAAWNVCCRLWSPGVYLVPVIASCTILLYKFFMIIYYNFENIVLWKVFEVAARASCLLLDSTSQYVFGETETPCLLLKYWLHMGSTASEWSSSHQHMSQIKASSIRRNECDAYSKSQRICIQSCSDLERVRILL